MSPKHEFNFRRRGNRRGEKIDPKRLDFSLATSTQSAEKV